MELLTMAVLLKNLTARTPNTEDLAALSELVRSCESSADSMAGSTLEELLSEWQRPDFHLANDAWVIVTTRGQIVGFAGVWHEEHTRISTFICVHPDYRNRGIGTLLLRMAELRARQHIRQSCPGERVVLQGLINSANEGAHRLFEREGYQMGRPFLRISFTLAEESETQERHETARKLKIDVGLDQHGRWPGVTPLCDQDALCSVHLYRTYEKELRPAAQYSSEAKVDLQAMNV
ncbi:MAG TPA: GNAT family N-acetyltransferase [Ktedonobacteraceae bacterium]|nr:GNAT family N-acetyltransferase [Ktedonobacteraceae bacterium]